RSGEFAEGCPCRLNRALSMPAIAEPECFVPAPLADLLRGALPRRGAPWPAQRDADRARRFAAAAGFGGGSGTFGRLSVVSGLCHSSLVIRASSFVICRRLVWTALAASPVCAPL